MAQHELTRRAIVGGSGLAALALASPLIAETGTAQPGGIRPAFQAAYDAIGKAANECRRHGVVFDAAKARCDKLEAQVPHVSFDAGESMAGTPLVYTTANPSHVATCRRLICHWSDKRNRFAAGLRRFVAAATWRERAIATIRKLEGLDAAWEKENALSDAWSETEDAFVVLPVASLAELDLKIAHVERADLWGNSGVPQAIAADVRRLAGKEG
jgi:hypothetical protein